MISNDGYKDGDDEMRAINEKLVIAGVRQHELAETAQQANRRAEDALNELRATEARYKNIAHALQRPMLFQPKEDAFSGLIVQTAYATASEEALVGGDFWDTFAYNHGHVAFVLGDVMGHGLTSAIFTTELKHTMRGYIREHEQPGRVLFQMNQFLYQTGRLFDEGINTEGSNAPVCITLATVARETGQGTVAIAGMETPVIVRANGETEMLQVTGLPLGVRADEQYVSAGFQLEADDTLILFTDGITEVRGPKRGAGPKGHRPFLETEGLLRLAVSANGGTLKAMADGILNGARDFAAGTLHDDASLVLVRRTATSPNLPKNRTTP